jgi:hypothetical protein
VQVCYSSICYLQTWKKIENLKIEIEGKVLLSSVVKFICLNFLIYTSYFICAGICVLIIYNSRVQVEFVYNASCWKNSCFAGKRRSTSYIYWYYIHVQVYMYLLNCNSLLCLSNFTWKTWEEKKKKTGLLHFCFFFRFVLTYIYIYIYKYIYIYIYIYI